MKPDIFKVCYKKVNGKKYTREEYFALYPQLSGASTNAKNTRAPRKPAVENPKVISISDWLAWRMKGIGGSDAPAVMNASPWCDPQKLWELKTGRRAPDPQTYPMRRGLRLEPIARDRYQDMTGIEMPADRAENASHDFIRATLDGVNYREGKALEIKCPGAADHAIALRGEIPEKYIWQLVHILLVTDLDSIDYFSFDGENGVIVPFDRDRHLERKLFPKEIEFWERVVTDLAPNQIEKEKLMNQSNTGQKKPENGIAFTARETVEILQLAKQLGVERLKLPGFEADFKPQGVQAAAPTPAPSSNIPRCGCGSLMVPSKTGKTDFYCKPCFIEDKESRKRW